MSVSVSGGGQVVAVVSGGTANSVEISGSSASPVANVFVATGASPAVTVSGGTASPVSVSGPTAQAAILNVSVSPGIGPTVVVDGTSTSIVGTAGVNPFIAGDNITVTTTGGGITIIGRDPPVYSVQGKTGTVTLSVIDLTASPAVHTHSTTSITGLVASIVALSPVKSVMGLTGNVLLSVEDISAAAASHTHTFSDVTDFETGVKQYADVKSVNGQTGEVVFSVVNSVNGQSGDVTITSVNSVNGQTGDVSLDYSAVSAAASSHQHAYADISDFQTGVEQYANVKSVNGSTGEVTIDYSSVGAAAASHQHIVADISDITDSSVVVNSVNGHTGAVTIVASDVTAVESVNTLVGAVSIVGTGGASVVTRTGGYNYSTWPPQSLPAQIEIDAAVPWGKVPSTRESGGNAGDVAYDREYIYIKSSSDGWLRSPLASPWTADQHFANVELLLHLDGNLNDSSSHSRTATTANGTPSYSTSYKKFGSHGAWFNYGTSVRVSFAADSAWDIGTGDYTAELFFYVIGAYDSYSPPLPLIGTDSWILGLDGISPSGPRGIVFNGTSSGSPLSFSGGNFPTDAYGYMNSFAHVALVRDGNWMRIFVNGEKTGELQVNSASFTSGGTSPLRICGDSNGSIYTRIDEVRVTKGVARYTKNFLIPGAAFPNA